MQRAGGCGGQCEGLLASAVGRKVMSLYLADLKLLEIGSWRGGVASKAGTFAF